MHRLALLALALPVAASAAPADYTPKGEAHGCQLFLGPTEDDGVVPMRAECRWPELPPSRVAAVIDDVERHDQVFGRVSQVRILEGGTDDGRLWHYHAVPIIADREIVIDWSREVRGDTTVWTWKTSDVEVPIQPTSARCERWEGRWDVGPDGRGGTVLVHENHYEPGGFPAWLIRPFLAGELSTTVGELRRAADRSQGGS